jgi:hypothetical protein
MRKGQIVYVKVIWEGQIYVNVTSVSETTHLNILSGIIVYVNVTSVFETTHLIILSGIIVYVNVTSVFEVSNLYIFWVE